MKTKEEAQYEEAKSSAELSEVGARSLKTGAREKYIPVECPECKRKGEVREDILLKEGAREKFMRMYANLPLNIRKNIIYVLGEEPISYFVAYLEIKGNTEIGTKILEGLSKLDLI